MNIRASLVWMMSGLYFVNSIISVVEASTFIDSVREEIPQADSDSYIEKKQREFKKAQEQDAVIDEAPYIESLQTTVDEGSKKKSESFIDTERSKLDGNYDSSSVVEALGAGTEAKLNVPSQSRINRFIGFKYGLSRALVLSGQEAVFDSIYGSQYAPEFALYYEYQPLHDEVFGSLGIVAMAGVGYYRGAGQFSFAIPKPSILGGNFVTSSTTSFTFLTLPMTLAVDYRFNLLRYLRPYIMVGPTGVLFFESRSDGQSGTRSHSKSLLTSVGVSVLLDWMSRGATWDRYQMHGMQHFYFIVDYTRVIPLDGDIKYGSSGISLGLGMEY